jgi:hypothetical protein
VLQSCAYYLGQPLYQDSVENIHSAEKNDASYERAAFFTEMKQKKIQNGRLKKTSFSSSANSQYFFMKISWIGPWVSRID